MAKSYPAPTTGYLNNGGLVQLGKSNIADAWDYITIPAPNQPWRIVVDGTIPDDTSGVACSVSVFEGTLPLFSASGTWQTQGQSSLGSNKKNWKFKLRNATTGNKLAVKIGKWLAMSSITVKGYGTDRTLMRDSLTTELWRRMHAYPSGLLAPISAYQYFDDEDFGLHQSALFSTAGFPVELWNGGKFLGLYVLRADNDPSSYLMDTDNQKHILMQPQHASSLWSSPYNSTVWDFPSPTVKGYETGDGMGGLNSDVDQAAARVVNWMYGCVTGSIDFRSTYKSYLDLNSALDFILLNEVSLSFDSLNNNFMFGSWDATKNSGIWHFWPYDEDETFGVAWFLSADGQINPDFGWVTEDNSGGNNQQAGIFKIILQQMRPEIRARWRELRDAGIISVKTINGVLMDQGAMIDPATMAADIANWPKSAATGNQIGVIKVAQSMGYITQISARRIAWLDAQWGYSA